MEYQRKIKEERYQEQEHNMRTAYVSPTIRKKGNRTRGVTLVFSTYLYKRSTRFHM